MLATPPAPKPNWIPFWAITCVGPTPCTRFRSTVAIVPAMFTTMPPFW
jgi:hypothetical protein